MWFTGLLVGGAQAQQNLPHVTWIATATEDDGDCDDADFKVHPGADEYCGDSIDNNCDGTVDEDSALMPRLVRGRRQLWRCF